METFASEAYLYIPPTFLRQGNIIWPKCMIHGVIAGIHACMPQLDRTPKVLTFV